MKSYKAEGIVIKRRSFGEADRILTVFTKKHGKIKVLAKGVRRITSRRSSNIELFNQVELMIHQGKSFDILTEAQVLNTFQSIRKNLDLVGLAFHVCEVVDGLCPEDQAHPKVYDLMLGIFNELDHGLIQKFEHNLLLELGYLSSEHKNINTTLFIENILERKLKTRKIVSRF